MSLYIGIMSGTSADGVDTVLVDFENSQLKIVANYSEAFPVDLKNDIDQLLTTSLVNFLQIGEVDHRLALFYADCVNKLLVKAQINLSEVQAIGCHGQTVFHAPQSQYPFTMQLGNGHILSAKTGITTVMDFRRTDMAFGGEGAPLTPAFHQAVFFKKGINRAVLNLGGIANITILAENEQDIIGFDTGPANCLMDGWINTIKKKEFDDNGEWAKSGRVHTALLKALLQEKFFTLPAPKSTGRELFNMKWLDKFLINFSSVKDNDVQATLLELTAVTVSDAIKNNAVQLDEMYVCGGGAYNNYLLERIAHHLPDVKIATTKKLGIPPKLVEAVAFAWLAERRIEKSPSNLPSVTGASQKVLQGIIFPKNDKK